ncbi:MAG: hypothetical protein ACLFQX_08220 [Candidatus Kapaibacterium sp.]
MDFVSGDLIETIFWMVMAGVSLGLAWAIRAIAKGKKIRKELADEIGDELEELSNYSLGKMGESGKKALKKIQEKNNDKK